MILRRRDLLIYNRAAHTVHVRCAPEFVRGLPRRLQGWPSNRLLPLVVLNAVVLGLFVLASSVVPGWSWRQALLLLLVIDGGLLLGRATLWWSIERHLPR